MGQNENAPRKVIPFYAVELRHLVSPRARIIAQCRSCKKSGDLDPLELGWRLGPGFSIGQLHKRLKCEHCGMKGWTDISLEWLEPG